LEATELPGKPVFIDDPNLVEQDQSLLGLKAYGDPKGRGPASRTTIRTRRIFGGIHSAQIPSSSANFSSTATCELRIRANTGCP